MIRIAYDDNHGLPDAIELLTTRIGTLLELTLDDRNAVIPEPTFRMERALMPKLASYEGYSLEQRTDDGDEYHLVCTNCGKQFAWVKTDLVSIHAEPAAQAMLSEMYRRHVRKAHTS